MPGAREVIVSLPAHVDIAHLVPLRALLARAATEERRTLVVDFSAVTSIDTSCLAVLVGVQRQAVDAGRTLVLRRVDGITRALLESSGLDLVFEIEELDPAA